ncbi:MAG: hypothetical protein ABIP48_10475 [Planctomycetota bacterium]
MNYFAHAYPFLDDPYFAAGTGVPDWLTVADRPVRVRLKHAEPLVDDPDPPTASVARGIIQHIRDDARFHATRAFTELSLELSGLVRGLLVEESGFRPPFLGHLLVEVLLDASLIAEDPARLEAYYRTIESVDPRLVEDAVNRMAPRPTTRLALMISRFCEARILWDYLEDVKLLKRLDQVMRRAKLASLPELFLEVLPEARRRVDLRKAELLDPVPTKSFGSCR